MLSELLNRSCWTVHAPKTPRSQVCLDLDGTLFDNSRRTLQILRTYFDNLNELLPAHIDHRKFGYGPLDAFTALNEQHGIEVSETAQKNFMPFWKKRFFTDEWQRYDEVAPGSPAFVQALIKGGCDIVYLTGRDRGKMMLGVVKALRDNGFPVMTPETRVVLKPHFDMKDLEFKIEAITELSARAPIIGMIDNEPPICNAVHELLSSNKPSCLTALFDSPHAPEPPPLHAGVTVMNSFELT